jgi:hypothetical protein
MSITRISPEYQPGITRKVDTVTACAPHEHSSPRRKIWLPSRANSINGALVGFQFAKAIANAYSSIYAASARKIRS